MICFFGIVVVKLLIKRGQLSLGNEHKIIFLQFSINAHNFYYQEFIRATTRPHTHLFLKD